MDGKPIQITRMKVNSYSVNADGSFSSDVTILETEPHYAQLVGAKVRLVSTNETNSSIMRGDVILDAIRERYGDGVTAKSERIKETRQADAGGS